ncbi:MAG: hypothetical protein JRI23_34090 [Deltaproteobacteria bacterium]|nr:hypothetical protein [Deltaproteobacteria bacterium]MBW2537328.1 hypothetical protein [Deltaproteobacteria bacterium]
MVALTIGAFWASDAWFADDARQEAADQWQAFQRCLLGDGRPPNERPSVRLAGIALAIADAPPEQGETPWLEGCRPRARTLDRALARPALRASFASRPSAESILGRELTIQQRGAALDELWRAVRAADLPLPRLDGPQPTPVAPAPAPALPMLRHKELVALSDAPAVPGQPWAIRRDLGTGRELRLLSSQAEGLRLCRIGDGPEQRPYGSITCRQLPSSLPAQAHRMELSGGTAGGAALLYVATGTNAEGVYDAASGQRIWRPRSAAQAFVRKDGDTLILYGVPDEDAPSVGDTPLELSSPSVDHVRLVRFRPGRAPRNRRVSAPTGARFLLLGDRLLSWHDTGAHAQLDSRVIASDEDLLARRHALGRLPSGATVFDACVTDAGTAVLFAAPAGPGGLRHFALAFTGDKERPPVALGAGPSSSVLSCHGGHAVLASATSASTLRRWRCDSDGCDRTEQPLQAGAAGNDAETIVGALADRSLVLRRSAEGGLRLRWIPVAGDAAATEAVLLDPATVEQLAPTSLRMFTHEQAAILIMRSAHGSSYAIRIDRSGQVAPLSPRQRAGAAS